MHVNLRFVHVSDLHILGTPEARIHGTDTGRILQQAIARINRLHPDFVVATGDLSADGSPASYGRLRELLASLQAPLHVCPGNHDHRAALRAAFGLAGSREERVHEAFDAGGHRFLLLDSLVPGKEEGRLTEAELAWADEALRGAPAAPTWLFLHHQPLPVHIRWLDTLGLADADALLDLLARHPQVRGVGYGHVHLPRRWRYRGVLFASVPALAFQFSSLSQEPEVTHDAPGLRLVEVADGESRDWLYFLDGRVAAEPRMDATAVYVRSPAIQRPVPA